jgi:hypothetical protein
MSEPGPMKIHGIGCARESQIRLRVAGRRVEVRLSAALRVPPLTRRPAPGGLLFRISRTKGFSRQFNHLELKANFLNF